MTAAHSYLRSVPREEREPVLTLEVQAETAATSCVHAALVALERIDVMAAAGVVEAHMPLRLRLVWRELVQQRALGYTDVDLRALHTAMLVYGADAHEHWRTVTHDYVANELYGAQVERYAATLVEARARQALSHAHASAATAQLVQDDAAFVAAEAEVTAAAQALALLRDTGPSWLDDVAAVVLDATAGEAEELVSTGLRRLDHHLGGGFGPGWLVVVMGGAKSGKTALAVGGFALAAAKAGKRVLVASLEMSRKETIQRLLSAESGVPVRGMRARDLTPHQQTMLTAGSDTIAALPIDVVTGLVTVNAICAKARSAHARGGLHMLVVDYLQLVNNGNENRVLDIEQTTRGLKLLAQELGCVVVMLSQPNNSDAKSGEVGLYSGKGSGSIAADCDALLVPLRSPDEPSKAGLHLAGCRHAEPHKWPLGELRFDGGRMQFQEVGP